MIAKTQIRALLNYSKYILTYHACFNKKFHNLYIPGHDKSLTLWKGRLSFKDSMLVILSLFTHVIFQSMFFYSYMFWPQWVIIRPDDDDPLGSKHVAIKNIDWKITCVKSDKTTSVLSTRNTPGCYTTNYLSNSIYHQNPQNLELSSINCVNLSQIICSHLLLWAETSHLNWHWFHMTQTKHQLLCCHLWSHCWVGNAYCGWTTSTVLQHWLKNWNLWKPIVLEPSV
jgi:hypothetical protein